MSCDDLEEARDLLRHKDTTVTAKVYRARFTAERREALRASWKHGIAPPRLAYFPFPEYP